MKEFSPVLLNIKVLFVEDEPVVREEAGIFLRKRCQSVYIAENGKEGLDLFLSKKPDIVITDIKMPLMDGIELSKKIKEISPATPIIITTAFSEVSYLIKAIEIGIDCYLQKPVLGESLVEALYKLALPMAQRLEIAKLNEEVQTSLDLVLGACTPMRETANKMRQVAKSQANVLLQGETGVGKSFAAKIIHDMSPRSKNPFIKLDLSSLPESIVESELFGHEKGAFTGAEKERKGYFRLAEGGTIFIDEIENISPLIQSKLLNVVEEKCFMPVGGSVVVKIDVRIIAATNKDPHLLVQEGKLRQDIFYRLNEFSINIPPLRERKDDILALAYKFINLYSDEYGFDKMSLSSEAAQLLESYNWPGNVRELRNVIRRAIILASDNILDEAKIREAMDNPPAVKTASIKDLIKTQGEANSNDRFSFSFPTLNLQEIEKDVFLKAFLVAEEKKLKAASLLGIDYKTFISRAKKYGLV